MEVFILFFSLQQHYLR